MHKIQKKINNKTILNSNSRYLILVKANEQSEEIIVKINNEEICKSNKPEFYAIIKTSDVCTLSITSNCDISGKYLVISE